MAVVRALDPLHAALRLAVTLSGRLRAIVLIRCPFEDRLSLVIIYLVAAYTTVSCVLFVTEKRSSEISDCDNLRRCIALLRCISMFHTVYHTVY